MPLRPTDEEVGVTLGDAGGDLHGGAAGAAAVAVGDEHPARAGDRGVGGRVVHLHAEVAGPAVEVEGAGLEDGGHARVVEVGEVDEVPQQPEQVPAVADHARHLR